MPTKLFPLLLALLVGAAVLIAEEQRIGGLRKTIAQLSAEAAEAAGARERLAREAAELANQRERNDALVAESEELRTRLASAKAGGAATAPTDGNPSPSPAKTGEKGNWMAGLAKMFSDPGMKKLIGSQQSAGTRMMYAGLAKELGLSADQEEKVLELLAARQAAAGDLALSATAGDPSDPTKTAEVAANDAKIKALLGPEKAAKLNEYERTTGDRMAIRQYQRSLSAASLPLDDNQSAGLLQIMKEERMKVPANPLEPGGKNPLEAMTALQDGKSFDQSLQSQRELNQRVLARAHNVLTPDQMTSFEAAQKQQLQMQEMGVKMGKAIFGGGK